MSKYVYPNCDYAIRVYWADIKGLRQAMFNTYEREAGNLGQYLKITKEDCKSRIQKYEKLIAELESAIEVLRKA